MGGWRQQVSQPRISVQESVSSRTLSPPSSFSPYYRLTGIKYASSEIFCQPFRTWLTHASLDLEFIENFLLYFSFLPSSYLHMNAIQSIIFPLLQVTDNSNSHVTNFIDSSKMHFSLTSKTALQGTIESRENNLETRTYNLP